MNDPTNGRYRFSKFKGDENARRFIQDKNAKSLHKASHSIHLEDIPAHGSYGSLLFDPRWKAKRQEILEKDNFSCVVCRAGNNLQVHHRQYHFNIRNNKYNDPWDYESHLLITLCDSCHKRGHNKFRVPTIHI